MTNAKLGSAVVFTLRKRTVKERAAPTATTHKSEWLLSFEAPVIKVN